MRPRGNPHTDRRRIERTAEHRRRRRRPSSQTTGNADRISHCQYDVDFPMLSPPQASSSVAPSSLAVDAQTDRQESRSLFGVAPGHVAHPFRNGPSQLAATSGACSSLPNCSPSLASPSTFFSEGGVFQRIQGRTIGRRPSASTSNINRQPHTMARVQEQLDMMRGLLTGALTADDAQNLSATMAATLAHAGSDEDWLGMLDDQGDVFAQPWARQPGGINRSDRPRRPISRTDLNAAEVARQNEQSNKTATFVYRVEDAKTGSDVWPDIRDPTKLPATFMPLDMANTVSSLRADVDKLRGHHVDEEVKRPVWPMNELPSEIYYLITETLSRDDIKAMRLTCKEMEHHISGILFRNVVVPFNTEIYGMMLGRVDKKGKGKAKLDGMEFWKNSKEEDIYTGHGVDVFRSFGSSMKKFGMSFEVNEEVLANPPLKGTREDHKSYWGVYQWPFPEYKRFDQVAGLEDAADETPKMKTAFSFLNDVRELALSLDAGLGWLNGPDRSLRSRVLGEKRPVFGNGHAVLGRKEEARQWLWKYLKEWADGRSGVDLRHCTISKQSYRDALDSPPPRLAQESTYNRQFSSPRWAERDSDDLDDFDEIEEQSVLLAPTNLPLALDSSSTSRSPVRNACHSVQDMDSDLYVRPPPFVQNRFDTSTSKSLPFSLHLLQPSWNDVAVPPLDLQGLVDPVAKPTPLLTLMENVHLQQMLMKAQPDPIAPKARERGFLTVKEDTVEPERLEAYPIVPAELSKLQKEWLLETEWAQRAFLSSWLIAVVDNRPTFQHVHIVNFARLSSRFLLSLCREDLWKALPQLEKVVLNVIPDCRDVVKDNAGFVDTPRVLPIAAVWLLHKLVSGMIATRHTITRLELGWVDGGERAQGMLARNKHLMPSPLLPPEWLGSADHMLDKCMLKARMLRLPHVRELTLRNCWSTPFGLELLVGEHPVMETLRLESVSLTAEPVGAGANAQAHQPGGPAQNPGLLQVLGVSDPSLTCRHGSWPHLLETISPSGESENNVATTLRMLEIRSAGYCRLNNARLDESAIPPVYGGGTAWFAKRHAALSKVMLNGKGGVTAEVVQAIPPNEQQALTGLGLEMGWPRDWADEAEGCMFDGLLLGGTGRFSGVLSAN